MTENLDYNIAISVLVWVFVIWAYLTLRHKPNSKAATLIKRLQYSLFLSGIAGAIAILGTVLVEIGFGFGLDWLVQRNMALLFSILIIVGWIFEPRLSKKLPLVKRANEGAA